MLLSFGVPIHLLTTIRINILSWHAMNTSSSSVYLHKSSTLKKFKVPPDNFYLFEQISYHVKIHIPFEYPQDCLT